MAHKKPQGDPKTRDLVAATLHLAFKGCLLLKTTSLRPQGTNYLIANYGSTFRSISMDPSLANVIEMFF